MKHHRNGFSLIEILIVVAIATSIVFVVGDLGGNTTMLSGLVSNELQSKADIDQTLQIMTTEIRSASPSAGGAYPVESAATSSFVFYTNGGNNSIVKKVRYFLTSSTIYRGAIQPTGTPATYPASAEIVTDMIDNVVATSGAPLFRYYGSSYAGAQGPLTSTVDVSPVRIVGMSFYSTVAPDQSPAPQYFSRFVDIRNLRSN